MILEYSDWKQKIAFDNILYKEVKRFSLRLNTAERGIMDEQINFYRHNFSLLQVMNHFSKLKTKEQREDFVKFVLKKVDQLLYLPELLVPHFKSKIKSDFADYNEFFAILLQKAKSQSKVNLALPIYKAILGGYFSKIRHKVKKLSRQKEQKIMQKSMKSEAIVNTARLQIAKLQDDRCLAEIYGRSMIRKTVPISVVNNYGYGEWKSGKVSFSNDRLFIYSNNNKLTDIQLEHAIYFNIYPGYAHFYNMVVGEKTRNNFDNGATFLLNGWAMYSMCNSRNAMYSANMLIEGATIAKRLLSKNLDKAYRDIYIYLLTKYPKNKAIDYMLDYTQYIGHYMSYVLGCLAIEECINRGFANNPKDFLQNLSQINCGDYFAIYCPKKQRKISKTLITAKVVAKFEKV